LFKMKMNTQIFLAIVLGVLTGLYATEFGLLVSPIGDVFLSLLKMIVIPLVLTSIVMGIVSLGDIKNLGKLGGWTALFFVVTTVISSAIGLVAATVFSPGKGHVLDIGSQGVATAVQPASIIDLIVDIVPQNVFKAMADGSILPVIFFAMVLGTALISIGDRGKAFVDMIDGFNEILLKIVDWIMMVAPIGIFALIASLIARTGMEAFKPVALYVGTVLFGLGVHAFLVLPMIVIVLGKRSPIQFFRDLSPALAMAFSTSSSVATLPITMDCLKKRSSLSQRVVGFVCPLGATVNMDGTALYQLVAAVFIAQVYGITLTPLHLATILFTAVMASIAAAGIPGAGLITMVIIFNSVGIPIEGLGLILAVDRILDMCRTTVNVYSDSVGALVISRTGSKEGVVSPG